MFLSLKLIANTKNLDTQMNLYLYLYLYYKIFKYVSVVR